jgi:hypothetical protein
MIRLLVFRLWPAFLPLLIYILWHWLAVRRAVKKGLPPPHFRDKPLYWVVIASLGIAALCFLWMGFSMEEQRGVYIPPMVKDGTMVPGNVE